jgi:hypothetical protein
MLPKAMSVFEIPRAGESTARILLCCCLPPFEPGTLTMRSARKTGSLLDSVESIW